MKVHAPFIEYESPQVEVKVALYNVSPTGRPLEETPLHGEEAIREAMMEFVQKVQGI